MIEREGGMTAEATMIDREKCPRCFRRLIHKRDGIFGWRVCPATKSCGWTVFTHGEDARDKATA